MIKFSAANTKLKKLYKVAALAKWLDGGRKVYSFDLLSGYACPQAEKCMARAVQTENGRRILDGPLMEFRCFSASQEVLYTNVYNLRKANFDAIRSLKTVDEIVSTIQAALPKNAGIVRIHVAGDFFNKLYFQAWLRVARNNPSILFYAYTKALNNWIENREVVNAIPNLVLTASRGGRLDHYIDLYQLREAIVFNTIQEADDFNFEVDDDDSHAATPEQRNKSFALIIHGTQPKKPKAKKKALTIVGA